MYRIGEFSILSKTTVKTLRYYEKEGILIPSYVDEETGYRYYETTQLVEFAKIMALRQMGLSISHVKDIMNGKDVKEVLVDRKNELEKEISTFNNQLIQINNLLEEKNMKYEVVIKELPECTVYYKEGMIHEFADIVKFILSSAEECKKTNPDIKCVQPEYCYVSYLDGEYKENDFTIRYAQAVTEAGIPNETINFEDLKPIKAACIYHKGSYTKLREAYSYILQWITDSGYEIAEPIRERYIDGMWNKESEEDWLTEIQVPIKK